MGWVLSEGPVLLLVPLQSLTVMEMPLLMLGAPAWASVQVVIIIVIRVRIVAWVTMTIAWAMVIKVRALLGLGICRFDHSDHCQTCIRHQDDLTVGIVPKRELHIQVVGVLASVRMLVMCIAVTSTAPGATVEPECVDGTPL